MESNVIEDTIHEVRVIETDQAAVSASVRRLELCIGVVCAICLAVVIWAFCIYVPLSHDPLFPRLLVGLAGICLILLGLIHFITPVCLRKMDVLIGSDFIAGPECDTGNPASFLIRLAGRKIIIRYNDIMRVLLDISKGRITGATVVGKGLTMILVRRVTEPHTVIEAIREHTGPEVQWRRSPPWFTKLSEDDVDSLIDKTERKISMNRSNNLFETNITPK